MNHGGILWQEPKWGRMQLAWVLQGKTTISILIFAQEISSALGLAPLRADLA